VDEYDECDDDDSDSDDDDNGNDDHPSYNVYYDCNRSVSIQSTP